MNKEKVFAWIKSLEDMADQSDRYFVERTELYKENQEKDKEIERLNNIINELEKWLEDYFKLLSANADMLEQAQCDVIHEILDKLKELKEGK